MFIKSKALAMILILIAVVYFQQASCHCINSDVGEDIIEICASNISAAPCCKSLQYLIKSLKAQEITFNVTIYIENSIVLDSVLNITGFEKLLIQGEDSTISCSSGEAGIYIKNVKRLELLNFTITNCSMLQRSSTYNIDKDNVVISEQVMCAVYILDSIDLTIENAVIINNRGTGMIIYNTKGVVQILDSKFHNNTISEGCRYSGGGGLVIELTYCKLDGVRKSTCNRTTVENSTYSIQGCSFVGNLALQKNASMPSYRNSNNSRGFGRGGGLFIALRGQPKGNSFSILQNKFIDNIASTWGGGMYLSVKDSATSNSIKITQCKFKNNICTSNGGGGLIIVIGSYHEVFLNNEINIENCNFTGNSAIKQGGGVLLHSSRERDYQQKLQNNRVSFLNCVWTLNRAALGSAVDIAPSGWDVLGNGLLPTPNFNNCIFQKNHVLKEETVIYKGIKKITERVGTLFISRFSVELAGEVKFLDNNNNGIYIESGTLTILQNAKITFFNNTAKYGGGISLQAFSGIFFSSNSIVEFENNTATIKGGAIYVDTKDQHEKISSRSCFIQRSYDEAENLENATIIFNGNIAKSNNGNSIYVSSLQSCNLKSCPQENSEVNLGCIVMVQGLSEKDISTHVDDFNYAEYKEVNLNELIPGKPFKIPILAMNELNKTINVVYDESLQNANSSTLLEDGVPFLSYVTNQSIFLGQRNSQREENALLLTNNEITLSIDITVVECPPGHVHDKESKYCVCDTSNFRGIWKCDIDQ